MKDKTRILVVEDEPIVAEDLKVRLELLGYQVAGMARNGGTALELVEKERPDMVLMDIRLEGKMDGIQAADIIRKRLHLPVIFLTAYSEDATISSAKRTEPFGYLIKPFEDRELKVTIEMALYKHRIENALRENESRLSEAQRIAHIGSWVYDLAGKLSWSDEMYRIYGVSPDTYTPNAESFINLIHPDDRAAMQAWINACLAGEKPGELEFRSIMPDGTIHFISGRGELKYNADNRPGSITGTAQDITQRKLIEEELRKSEELFRKLIEAEPECVKLLTKEIILVDMNPAGLRIIEADSREQVIGTSFLGIIDPEYRDVFVDLVERVFNGESVILEFSITSLKGTKRWLETHAVPLLDDNGKINLLISVTRDITEHKHAEEERFAFVAREQAALAEAEAARKLSRMKSMFIASTSHELRTPLNSIIGFTSLILDGTSGELNNDQKEQLEIVHTSGKHLLALINDILDLSMIESGRITVVVLEFNLRQIVDEAVSNLNIILNEKKLELKVDVRDIKMKSDRTRIFQCIMNLLSNAIKYTEKGSVEITARVIGNNVEISVIDTGIGIKAKDIPRLFGPFVRLQSPLTLRTSGTGLGLYLVKKLAKDFLGGDVEVKSEFGKGSTFTLRVPVELKGIV